MLDTGNKTDNLNRFRVVLNEDVKIVTVDNSNGDGLVATFARYAEACMSR